MIEGLCNFDNAGESRSGEGRNAEACMLHCYETYDQENGNVVPKLSIIH